MKQRKILWIVLLSLCLLLVAQLAVRLLSPRSDGMDALYDRYSDGDGVRAALIRGKGVYCGPAAGDSVYVDMLLLSAADAEAWDRLCDEFGVAAPLPIMQARIDQGADIVSVCRYQMAPATADTASRYLRAVSHLTRTVSVIRADGEDDITAVRHAKMNENINNTKNV